MKDKGLSMTKYIKGKDGKFVGSIGTGKNRVPQIAPHTNLGEKSTHNNPSYSFTRVPNQDVIDSVNAQLLTRQAAKRDPSAMVSIPEHLHPQAEKLAQLWDTSKSGQNGAAYNATEQELQEGIIEYWVVNPSENPITGKK
jgi:hypothetical protein